MKLFTFFDTEENWVTQKFLAKTYKECKIPLNK